MSNFEFVNLTQFNKSLDNFLKYSGDAVKDELKKAAIAIEADARENSPVRTGNLKASYHHNFENINNYEVSVETNTEYAPFVELGTIKQAAQPHLEPALIKHKGKFFSDINTSLKKGWKKL